jgi:hypothetical protein
VLGTVVLAFETTICPLEFCVIRSPNLTDRVDDDVVVAFAVVADVVARAVVGTLVTAAVPLTMPLETAGAKIALPEIDGDVDAADGTTVPLAGVAPTLIEFVTAIVEAVVGVPVATVFTLVTTPFVTRAVAPLTVGVVAVVAGTTVPLAGVAPTPRAPVTARGEADAVDTAVLPVDIDPPDTVAAPERTTPPPPPPPTPPVTP